MKLIWLITLFAYNSLAAQLDSCTDSASVHGVDGIVISEGCVQVLKDSPISAAVSEDAFVYARNNMIMALDQTFTAGPQTQLSEIQSIRPNLQEEEGRIYVLNKNGDRYSILSFPIAYGGNIAPRRKLITDELSYVSSFALDAATKQIFAISQLNGWIKAFNLHADPDGRLKEHSTDVLSRSELEPLQAKDLCVGAEEVFVLESDRIVVFDKNLNLGPKEVIEGAGQLGLGSKIQWDKTKKALVVLNHEGPIISYFKDEMGYYVPSP